MKFKALNLLLGLLTISILLSSCSIKKAEPGNTAQDTIKIGVFEPLTGANADGGKLELMGIKLAYKLYPEVLGKKVELVVEDNKSDIVSASTMAADLVDKKKVVAVIGSWGSSFSMAAGDIFNIAKVPAVGASCTNPLVTQGNDYYFRVCFLDTFQGEAMANYAYHKLHARKIAILKEVNSDYAVGLTRFFSEAFEKLTNNDSSIVIEANYNTSDRDFKSQLENIKAKKPDAIFAPGNFTESALIIKEARKLGMKIPFIGGDTWETPGFIRTGQGAIQGAAFSTFFSAQKPATPETEKFLRAYRKEYKKESEPAADTALAYDAYILVLDAIKRAGEANSVKIRDKLSTTRNFPGAAGTINFDEDRNAVKNVIIKNVVNGKFSYLYTYDVSANSNKDSLKK